MMKFHNGPRIYTPNQITHWSSHKYADVGKGRKIWVHARPYARASLGRRLMLAMEVFLGRADVLYWPYDDED
jgi:hypothetical protein